MMKDAKPARAGKRISKKKACSFCVNKVSDINYISLAKEIEKNDRGYDKNGERRTRYITEKGKIIPRRMSGVCLKHQHMLTQAIKRARIMALIPFKAD